MTLLDLLKHELRAIFSNPAILLTVFGGVIFYSFLYPLPYIEQVPRDQQVVVVNLDGSQLSRRLEWMVDATPQVEISRRAYSIDEAQEIFTREKMAGVLVIPDNFNRDLLLGKTPTLSYAGDASYFLVYGTVLEGLSRAGSTLAGQVKVSRMVIEGESLALASKRYSATRLNIRSVFNDTSGYINYVIPAIFVLILHQTLVMGIGLLCGTQKEAQRSGISGYWQEVNPLRSFCVRVGVFVTIYWLLCMYYFGVSFSYYSIPRFAQFADLNLVILPFLLGGATLGISLGGILPRKELVVLVVLLSSIPLIFGSGFIWPLESIPWPLTMALQYIPVVPAIQMFLGVNQMGGEFMTLLPIWKQMWFCVGIYGAFALLLMLLRRKV